MEREQVNVGLLVLFGKPGEQPTLGKIVAVNPARAKVAALEARNGRPAGTRFNVPFHLIKSTNDQKAPAVGDVGLQKKYLRNLPTTLHAPSNRPGP